MTGAETLHPDGTDLDRFLYAPVGADRNGSIVTVLSALARLGFDPWQEARELAGLSRDAARDRLSALLCGFRDVPALDVEHGAAARRLTQLLPTQSQRHASVRLVTPASGGSLLAGVPILAVLMILLILAQFYFLGFPGLGG